MDLSTILFFLLGFILGYLASRYIDTKSLMEDIEKLKNGRR